MPFEQFIIFFLLLLTGFFCRKYNVFSDSAVRGLNIFIINIGYPCLVLARLTSIVIDHQIFTNFILAFGINLGLVLLFGLYARLYVKGRKFRDEEGPIIEFSSIASNNGFMGFPVAQTIFGDLGLLYMIGCNLASHITVFTYGITILKRGRGIPGEAVKKKLLGFLLNIAHPRVSVCIVGIILCRNQIVLPVVIFDFLDIVGAVVVPLAMISIGTMLFGNFGIHSFRKRSIIETAVNKLVIIPVLALLIVWFLPLDPLLKMIILVSCALPTAAIVSMLCEQYGHDKNLASETLVIVTLFSMVTIPVFIWLLGLL